MTMAADLAAIADRLFAGVMAPLVLGGALRPGHAIGARAALALGDGHRSATDLSSRVRAGRVGRARRLIPVDSLPEASAGDWALAAALHDVLQSANPVFCATLRRRAAVRILDLAAATIERVPAPTTVGEALSRHTWFARVPEITRTDAVVSWWLGSRTFLGVEPPRRLQAWPDLRRVSVARSTRLLLDLRPPLAVDPVRLDETVAAILARTPLTDLATCTRPAPVFRWGQTSLALVATRAGRTLVLRALDRLAPTDVDAVLERATRELLAQEPAALAEPAVALQRLRREAAA
jgi:hypothetical protein